MTSDRSSRQQRAADMKSEREQADRRQRNLISVAIVAVVVLLIGVAYWGISSTAEKNKPTGDVVVPQGLVDGGIPFPGPEAAAAADVPVVQVFEDFFCSHCGDFEAENGQWLRELAEEGAIDLRFHPYVVTEDPKQPAEVFGTMNAAVCVADETPGGIDFWETKTDFFSRAFYERGNNTDNASLIGYLGSNASDNVQECIRTEKFVPWLVEQTRENSDAGVSSTPTIIVDGTKVPEPTRAAIEAALGS